MLPDVKSEALKRLNYIQGHLEGVRRMAEEDQYCVEILKQLFAVRRATEKLEALLLDGHLRTCVVTGIRENRDEEVLKELLDLYTLANR